MWLMLNDALNIKRITSLTKLTIFLVTFSFIILYFIVGCSLFGRIGVMEGSFSNALLPLSVLNPASGISLVASKNTAMPLTGKSTSVLGYDGSILGPVLEANSGDTVSIGFTNNLSGETNIHWHGLSVPNSMDGLPMNTVAANTSYTYTYQIHQRASLYWYHPHPHGKTGKQVAHGLAGIFIVRDAQENALNLPSGEAEIPLVLQDKRFAADNSIEYAPSMMETMSGYLGEHILVNGRYSRFINIRSGWYRLRILNGSTARVYNLKFTTGLSFYVIGSDGGLLSAPAKISSLLLAPGERADILVNFSGVKTGSDVYLFSDTFSEGGDYQGYDSFKVLRFHVDRSYTDTFVMPAQLSIIPAPNVSAAAQSRNFDISQKSMTGMMGSSGTGHTINGKSYDMSRIDFAVQSGTTEIWTFDNTGSTEIHPIHIHAVQFQLLSRTGGRARILPPETAYKDTVLVAGGEKVKIIMSFPLNTGTFVLHCHNLEHEDSGMMMNFSIN